MHMSYFSFDRPGDGCAYICFELYELQASAVHRDDILGLGGALLGIGFWSLEDVG